MIKLKEKVNKTQIMNELKDELTKQLEGTYEPEYTLTLCMIGANKLFEKLRLPQVSNCSLCSKCGEPISSRWEESACYFKLEIGIDCMATEALFGKNDKTGFNHPAIKQGSGYQKLLIESKKGSEYMLCWNCHRDFVKQVGKFLKE